MFVIKRLFWAKYNCNGELEMIAHHYSKW